MSSFEQQISQRVQAFVSEITELARQQALETLSRSLSAGGGVIARRGRGRNGAAFAADSGGRRSAEQLEATQRALLSEITSRPGQRIEPIGQRLGVPTKELALPIRKLIANGSIRAEGQRRATKYFPGTEGGKARRGGRRKGSRA
jgi:hypothetical protein